MTAAESLGACFKPKGIIICSARATVFQASSGRKHRTGPDARLLQRRHSAMHQFLKFAVMEQPYQNPCWKTICGALQVWSYFLPAWNRIINNFSQAGTGVCYSGTTKEVYPPNRGGAGGHNPPSKTRTSQGGPVADMTPLQA